MIRSVARRLRRVIGNTKCLRNCHNRHIVLRLAPLSLFHIESMMETLLSSIRKSSPFLLVINTKRWHCCESSNSIIVTKTTKSLMYTVASSVDSAFPLAVVLGGGFFRSSGISFARGEFILSRHVQRCAAIHNNFSKVHVRNLTEMRQPFREVS